MRITSSVVSWFGWILIGVILMLSCGDDSRSGPDAACPAAEPPITGRISVVSQTQIIGPNSRSGQSAGCPEGALRLSGSCTTADLNPVRDVTLEQSGIYEATDQGWTCFFKNNEATAVTIKVSVVCLLPGG